MLLENNAFSRGHYTNKPRILNVNPKKIIYIGLFLFKNEHKQFHIYLELLLHGIYLFLSIKTSFELP